MFSVNGQLMQSWTFSKFAKEIDQQLEVTDLPAGLYDLVVGNGKEVVATRVIKIQ
jgi:hypothetical protein